MHIPHGVTAKLWEKMKKECIDYDVSFLNKGVSKIINQKRKTAKNKMKTLAKICKERKETFLMLQN